MKNVTPELVKAAKSAKSPAELSDILGVNGVKVSLADADKYFAQLNSKELSDDELSNIAGGDLCGENYVTTFDCEEGAEVELLNGKRCLNCNAARGITVKGERLAAREINAVGAHYLMVKCRECGSIILDKFNKSEVIIH